MENIFDIMPVEERPLIFTWEQVKPMLKVYQNHQKALKVPVKVNGVVTNKVLKGLRLDKGDVMKILENEEIVELFLFFAIRREDLGKDPNDQFITIVLGGINAANNLVTTEVANYCDPCPNKCPFDIDERINEPDPQ